MEYTTEMLAYPQLLARLNDSIPAHLLTVNLIARANYNLISWWKLTVLNVDYHSSEALELAFAQIESQTAMSRDSLIYQFQYVL